ncbi:hypothetical protein FA95DRAFT_1613622 [Auriscalpium vulgare]|uniref:Uncharacterized protein n=1 Tax=Auriscalpium vulgare TaxID=40419 RepID=A0ACB8R2M2_9AGAM|nr:hypothetical protein FA95DRAFT_1613622 [Auriscalpium vulgare]
MHHPQYPSTPSPFNASAGIGQTTPTYNFPAASPHTGSLPLAAATRHGGADLPAEQNRATNENLDIPSPTIGHIQPSQAYALAMHEREPLTPRAPTLDAATPHPVPQVSEAEERRQRLKTFVNGLGAAYALTPVQYSELHQLLDLGLAGDLNVFDLRFRLINSAMTLNVTNLIQKQHIEYNGFKESLDEFESCLENKFTIPKTQRDIIKRHAKDELCKPWQVAHTQAHLPVEKLITSDPKKYTFERIIGDPNKETVFRATCKDQVSTARGTYRNYLLDSVKKGHTLEQATSHIATKMRIGGAPYDLKPEFQLQVALLRKFVLQELAEGGPALTLPTDDNTADAIDGPAASKKQKKGKQPKGEDFWSLADAFLAGLVLKNGADRRNNQWKAYLSEVVRKDHEEFGVGSGASLAPLPVTYAPSQQILPNPAGTGSFGVGALGGAGAGFIEAGAGAGPVEVGPPRLTLTFSPRVFD